jgi:hypothetical protein
MSGERARIEAVFATALREAETRRVPRIMRTNFDQLQRLTNDPYQDLGSIQQVSYFETFIRTLAQPYTPPEVEPLIALCKKNVGPQITIYNNCVKDANGLIKRTIRWHDIDELSRILTRVRKLF